MLAYLERRFRGQILILLQQSKKALKEGKSVFEKTNELIADGLDQLKSKKTEGNRSLCKLASIETTVATALNEVHVAAPTSDAKVTLENVSNHIKKGIKNYKETKQVEKCDA